MELLAPAGSMEALRAAVCNGADAVYLGAGTFNARMNARNFSAADLQEAIVYCHVRGVKVHLTLNTLVLDREMQRAADLIRMAAAFGVDAFIVQDLGVVSLCKEIAPDVPVHASTQMSIHSLEGVLEAAALGCSRVVLSRELPASEIAYICKKSPVEIEVFVHGALCMCYSGQCYLSSVIGRRSGNRGQCAQPCRLPYGYGRFESTRYPLSLKDNCLVGELNELRRMGVASLKIEGRMKRPEYVAIVTRAYRTVLNGGQLTQGDLQELESAFSRQGFTDGYFQGRTGADMFGRRQEGEDTSSLFASARATYEQGEAQRIGVKFYAILQSGRPAQLAVEDPDGNVCKTTGPVPEPAQRAPLTAQSLADQFAKTGGTPYYSTGTESRIDPELYLPAAAVNDLRRRLITGLKEERAALPERRSLPLPLRPEGKRYFADPALIVQVHQAEQLTQELAALRPAYVYVPVEILDSDFPRLAPFLEQGAQVAAVLPRVITDDQAEDMHAMLSRAAENGVQEALVGNMGHIFFARRAGMRVRGDFGLNVFNSFTEEVLQQAGLVSATASFELRVAQIRDLAKSIDTEMIVYGRLPCMITEQCIIRNSAGRCNCSVPNNLADRRGALFPVLPAFGHRNQIFNAHKLYLADKHEDYETAGLWGVRLMFTTETPRECVAVTQSYLGLTDYRPNGLTRGLYYRGVE